MNKYEDLKYNCLAIGSLPHTSVDEAMNIVRQFYYDIPFCPQLPRLSKKEDIYITKNKKTVAILKSPQTNAYENLLSLEGCLARFDDGTSYDDLKAEAILKK